MISRARFSRLLLFSAALSLASCALPPADPSAGERFVSSKEITEIQLYDEGLSYAARQRYVDAELSFRQAEYLEPDALNIKVNLAAVLERSGLFDEAEAILNKVIAAAAKDTRDARLVDFKLLAALGHLYATQNKFAAARKAYDQALSGAVDKPDMAAAATQARSLSALLWESGQEQDAQCYSALDLVLKPDREETVRHAKLLIARGLFDNATKLVTAFMENTRLPKDGMLLHLLGLAAWGREDFDAAAKLETAASDSLAAADAMSKDEVELARLLALRALAKAGRSGPDNETFDDTNREKLEKLTGEDGTTFTTLYWPVALALAYAEWQDEQAAADKGWSLKKIF